MGTDTDTTDDTNTADGADDPAVANGDADSPDSSSRPPDSSSRPLDPSSGPPDDEFDPSDDEVDFSDDEVDDPSTATTAGEEFVWGDMVGVESSEEAAPFEGDGTGSRHSLDPERYLLAGETLVERHDVRDGWMAVTTHRLLVFDPDAEDKRFETVDRPNVVGVGTVGGGNGTLRSYALHAGGYAVVLLGGGFILRSAGLQSLVSVSETGAQGVDGVLSTLSLVGALLGLIVDLLLVAGGLAVVLALGLSAWYLRSRAPTLVVERAGDDDVRLRLPTAEAGERLVTGIEAALADELAVSR